MTSYRILECARCGAVVADFDNYRVLWPSGEPHSCVMPLDKLDDITAQALAGGVYLDSLVAEWAAEWLTTGAR